MKGKKFETRKRKTRGDREGGGAMDGIGVVMEKRSAALGAEHLFAFAQLRRIVERVAVGAGEILGSTGRPHGATLAEVRSGGIWSIDLGGVGVVRRARLTKRRWGEPASDRFAANNGVCASRFHG